MRKTTTKRVAALLAVAILALSMMPTTAFAGEKDSAKCDENSVVFTDVATMGDGDWQEIEVVDRNGNPGVIRIECVDVGSSTHTMGARAAAIRTWEVSYTSLPISCYFHMDVSNNKVTSVYDSWVRIIGGTYDDLQLTNTNTYGKLTFRLDAYLGIMSATCWLKGTVTGSDNDITVSWEM